MTEQPPAGPVVHELRPLFLAALWLRHWPWTIGFPATVAAVTTVLVLVLPSQYTAETTFLPQSRSDVRLPTGIANLAGQLGLPLTGGGTSSPKFYADLVMSETIIDEILQRPIDSTAQDPPSERLLHWVGIGGTTLADSLFLARKYLRRHLATDVDRETGVVTISVTLRDPRVAAAVAAGFLRELEHFNADRRQSQARERRKFVEQRIADSERELTQAEDALRNFYESNRQYQSSPALVFQERRFQARVNLLTEVAVTLRREFESARIEEVNDTPVLTVVDWAQVPQRRSFPRRKLVVIGATSVSILLGGIFALLAEFLAHAEATDPEGRMAFARAWSTFRAALPSGAPRLRG
jgi:uncharacterized protein involved in exopolysaccharide biosynthesis